MKHEKVNCKEKLLFVIKQAFIHNSYVSILSLRNVMEQNECYIKPETIKRYLVTFEQDGFIYNAGRGWYSSIAKPFILETSPVKKVVSLMKKYYPLLDFSCWSTEQISRYGHHLLTKFVTFLYMDRYSMPSVSEFLIDKGYDVYTNPNKAISNEFVIRKQTILLRPTVKTQPNEGHFVLVEGILVELFFENIDLKLIDFDEYKKIFNNLSHHYRISISRFFDYAKNRKSSSLVKFVESTKTEFSINSSLVDLLKTT